MCRTTMFPHNQVKLRNTTPPPQGFFHALAKSFLASFAEFPLRLPNLPEILRVAEQATMPLEVTKLPEGTTGTQHTDPPKPKRVRAQGGGVGGHARCGQEPLLASLKAAREKTEYRTGHVKGHGGVTGGLAYVGHITD